MSSKNSVFKVQLRKKYTGQMIEAADHNSKVDAARELVDVVMETVETMIVTR